MLRNNLVKVLIYLDIIYYAFLVRLLNFINSSLKDIYLLKGVLVLVQEVLFLRLLTLRRLLGSSVSSVPVRFTSSFCCYF